MKELLFLLAEIKWKLYQLCCEIDQVVRAKGNPADIHAKVNAY